MISNSCKNSNQYTVVNEVVNSFIDIGAGLVLSMWFVFKIMHYHPFYHTDELFTRVPLANKSLTW